MIPHSPPPTLPSADASPLPVFQTLDRCASYPYTFKEYRRRFLWNLVAATLFRFSLTRAFRWRTWLLRRFGAKLGHHCYIRRGVRIFHPWHLTVGDWSSMADGVEIYNLGPVDIGSHTVISQGTYVCAGTHDHSRADLPLERPPIRVGSGVWIAAQAFIGPRVTIGDNSVVGARAVVTKDVPPGMVVGGNPARVLKPRLMPLSPAPATSRESNPTP